MNVDGSGFSKILVSKSGAKGTKQRSESGKAASLCENYIE